MHPRHGVEKTYLARVRGHPDQGVLEQLSAGVSLEDGVTAPAVVALPAADTIELTIHEGRNRQVRRMCEAVGHPVVQLHRSRYAGLELGDLRAGGVAGADIRGGRRWACLRPDSVARHLTGSTAV